MGLSGEQVDALSQQLALQSDEPESYQSSKSHLYATTQEVLGKEREEEKRIAISKEYGAD